MQELSVFTVGKKPQTRSVEPHAHSYIRAPYGVFKTKDSYITIAMANLKKLGELIGEPFFADLEDQTDSWTYRDEIYAMTRIKLEEKTTQEWLDLFRPVDIWCGPVYGYEEVVNDPQIKHNGTFVEYDHPTEGRVKTPGFPIRFSKTPSTVDRGAPRVGEHTREILAAAGKSEAEIDALLASGAVKQANV
jgi:crotonobetainyl-CoA:carnitine CoA-transferase CaiB-like acyl-CoA transferase